MKFAHLTILLALGIACSPAGLSAQPFTKVTDVANPVVTDAGPGSGSYAGASWIDYDNDGDLDLFVNKTNLYRNDGNGVFVRIAGAPSGQVTTFGNSWADIDNDGDLDVYLSGGGATGSSLFRNDGGDVFTKVTTGDVGLSSVNRAWGCAMGDYNHDGFADIVLAAAFGFAGINNTNRLFLNNGDGLYTRIDTGVVVTGTAPYTIPSWSDFDQDGDLDLFMGAGPANGTLAPDYLYRNMRVETGTAYFEKITTGEPATDSRDGQIFNWVDIDNDGDLDLYVTNYGGGGLGGLENDLYLNTGGVLTKVFGALGPIGSDKAQSLASLWGDFDNDGDQDCLVTNDGLTKNRFYVSNFGGSFVADTTGPLVNDLGPHYGATAGDYDGDGDLDIFVAGPGTAKGLFRNDLSNSNHWLSVKCAGTLSNRAGLGAKVRARAMINGVPVWQLREISAQNSFNGHSSLDAHFGLGGATTVDTLIVEWPSGVTETFTAVPVDRRICIAENGVASPERLIPPDGTGGQLTALVLRWRKGWCGGPYHVQVSTDSTFQSGIVLDDSTVTDTSAAIGGLQEDSVYYWRVRSRDQYPREVSPDFSFFVVGSILYNYSGEERWNLVSLPVPVPDPSLAAIFPTAAGPAHAYLGSGYVEEDSLTIGRGYWVKLPGPFSSSLVGTPHEAETLAVNPGWNLVGSAGLPVPVSQIVTIPGSLITSRVYGYGTGYAPADSIIPFGGYWVKAGDTGKIILEITPSTIPRAVLMEPPGEHLRRLTVTDRAGFRRTVYIDDGGEGAAGPDRYQLPPSPPVRSPDAYFGARTTLGNAVRGDTLKLESLEWPVTLDWESDVGARDVRLAVNGRSLSLSGTGSVTIEEGEGPVTVGLSAAEGSLPEGFRLEQNHPNPFNPVTTIGYKIPAEGEVEVAVYNAVGEKVRTFTMGIQSPGYHTIRWDGTDDRGAGVASGLYFYRLTARAAGGDARTYSDARGMVFMK